jgi:hypothetical protein
VKKAGSELFTSRFAAASRAGSPYFSERRKGWVQMLALEWWIASLIRARRSKKAEAGWASACEMNCGSISDSACGQVTYPGLAAHYSRVQSDTHRRVSKSHPMADHMVSEWLVTGMFKTEADPKAAAAKVIKELGSHELTKSMLATFLYPAPRN